MKEFGIDAQHVIEAAKSLAQDDDAYGRDQSEDSLLAGTRPEPADVTVR